MIDETTSHFKKTITGPNDYTILGRHMGLTLGYLKSNWRLRNIHTGDEQPFILFQLGFTNLTEHIQFIEPYRPSNFKLIDSRGFQHEPNKDADRDYVLFTTELGKLVAEKRFDLMGLSCVQLQEGACVRFLHPPADLEGHAKTVGWIWFESLPNDVRPARLIYRHSVHAPGKTSGWVQHMETLEFIIPEEAALPNHLALPA